MNIKKVTVIGSGIMGRQIALNSAISGFNTILASRSENSAAAVKAWEEEYLAGRIAKGRMTPEQVDAIKGRFSVVSSYEQALTDPDLIIEAIPEQEALKRDLFCMIEKLAPAKAIVATNSSYMVSSKFADCFADPSRLCNLHYYNPALVMKFVEVVKGPHTSYETIETVRGFAVACGKLPSVMYKEISGFIANYILSGIGERAWYLVDNGYCDWQDVDNACENGLGHKMGPFRLKDLTGIDLSYDIMKESYDKTGVKPAGFDTIKDLYDKGRYGRKNGHGFYDYE